MVAFRPGSFMDAVDRFAPLEARMLDLAQAG
jgi:hypothetical protein